MRKLSSIMIGLLCCIFSYIISSENPTTMLFSKIKSESGIYQEKIATLQKSDPLSLEYKKEFEKVIQWLCNTIPAESIKTLKMVGVSQVTAQAERKSTLEEAQKNLEETKKAIKQKIKTEKEKSKKAIFNLTKNSIKPFCTQVQSILYSLLLTIPGKYDGVKPEKSGFTISGFTIDKSQIKTSEQTSPNIPPLIGTPSKNTHQKGIAMFNALKERYEIYIGTILDVIKSIQSEEEASVKKILQEQQEADEKSLEKIVNAKQKADERERLAAASNNYKFKSPFTGLYTQINTKRTSLTKLNPSPTIEHLTEDQKKKENENRAKIAKIIVGLIEDFNSPDNFTKIN